MEVLSHLSKPIAVLRDKNARNDNSKLDRNIQHLNCLTKNNIKDALFGDLQELTEHMKRLDLRVDHPINRT
jgi:hypothetical protein